MSDISSFDNIQVQSVDNIRPILKTSHQKQHLLLMLEIFGPEFIENNLIDESLYNQIHARTVEIVNDDTHYFDLFGMTILRATKTR